jgi:hypothetical protein
MKYTITHEGWLYYKHNKWHQWDVPEDVAKKCIEEVQDKICELREDLEFLNHCTKRKL